jgi:hypothetical protein
MKTALAYDYGLMGLTKYGERVTEYGERVTK